MKNRLNKKSALIYAQAFYQSPVLMIISTLNEGRFIEVNQAFQKVLGYERHEVIGRTSNELGIWDGNFSRDGMLSALKASGRFEELEISLRAKSGEIKYFLSTAEIIETKEDICLLILLQDITPKKQSGIELAVSRKRLQQIAELAQDVIYSGILNPHARLDFISPSVERVLGYAAAEIYLDPNWLLNHIHPDDLSGIIAYLSNPPREIDPPPVVFRWVHKNGNTVFIEHRTSFIADINGQAVSFTGIGRDITDRKQAEEKIQLNESRLESLLKLSQFADPDVQHLLDYALQEAIQLTRSKIGYIYHYDEDRQDFVLNTWSKEVAGECKIQEPQTRYCLTKTGLWGEVVRQRQSIIVNDFQAAHPLKKGYPPGHVELFRFMSAPVFVNNKIVAVAGVANRASDYDQSDARQLTLLMDSTWKLVERRRADEERRLVAQRLEESYQKEKLQRQELEAEAKARGLFIDTLAHELRTPLTPILAASSMLQEISKDRSGVENQLTINLYRSAHNLASRLEELLDLARYARGTFKLNLRTVELASYLNDVIERFQPFIEQYHQELILNIASDLPAAQIDASRLEQVILNLLSNACKFSPERSEISFKAVTEGEYLRIDVQDRGIGITQEDHAKLFQPYHRVEQHRQKFPGIGLGLALSKQIVEAHGGKIWLTSQPGSGSTFSLSIPIKA